METSNDQEPRDSAWFHVLIIGGILTITLLYTYALFWAEKLPKQTN